MKFLSFIFIILSSLQVLQAQVDKNQALARQYYQSGDYVKAASLFEELWKDEPQNYYYYSSLFNSLVRLTEYDRLEDIVKKQQKKFKTDPKYQVDLGYVYSLNNNSDKATEEYEDVLKLLSRDENEIRTIANKFISYRKEDYAIKTYEEGNKLFKDDKKFAYELGSAFLRANEPESAIRNWLLMVDETQIQLQRFQNIMSSNINKEGVQDALEIQLYSEVQKNPNKSVYNELLIWLFTQQKDFESALIQAKALDKRQKEDGGRIMDLAFNAGREEMYDAAIDAYEYMLEKGDENRFYVKSKSAILNMRKLKILNTPNYNQEDILALKESYEDYLNTYGYNGTNANTIREFAHLQANYIHDLDKAISLLNDLITYPNITKNTKNQVKLDLGDYYVLSGDVWESTLLYAQVDKDEKDSPLGEDARYRNARLSYYKGEFEWAQAQLTILKGATTELIANDALDLSVFIMDNLGLDTTTTAMEMYASAELSAIQNKPNEAINTLDSILNNFPNHALTDNVLLEKANIAFGQRDYTKSIEFLLKLLEDHGDDILADDAAFMIADIYENYIVDTALAMDYYKKIITDYSDSVLVVEARKRYRALRGDDV